MIMVFMITAFSSTYFYVISWNKKYFQMNKIRIFAGKMESDFDLVDYNDWTFLNSVLYMN
jgi:hypothetical protein